MVSQKLTTLTLRINPAVKEAIRLAALKENRSTSEMVEVIIRAYCARNHIVIPEQQTLFENDKV
jgi:hypothetical protein